MSAVRSPASSLLSMIRENAHPFSGASGELDRLADSLGDSRIVLLGEASHGTEEFYRERARLTKRLIAEKGFTVVAAEADWPDALRVDRWVRGRGTDRSAEEALSGFERFPAWMWRNTVAFEFVQWLRDWNEGLSATQEKAGFYGLDLYGLYASISAVLEYLDRVDPEAARRARLRYECFEQFERDSQRYGYAASLGLTQSCEAEAIAQLVELRRRAALYASLDGRVAEDEYFYAEQNARLIQNAEHYYRSMFGDDVSSWNLRDRHMTETLAGLRDYFDRRRPGVRIVVWEHNSHVGDARATAMGARGEWNVGQLARERWPGETANLGFTTSRGTVTAASDWGAPAQRKRVRRPLAGSYEELFQEAALPAFWLDLRSPGSARDGLIRERLERAIGVIYRPETERWSHYFPASLSRQFDFVLHIDETTALEPLDRNPEWEPVEPPETFPSGL